MSALLISHVVQTHNVLTTTLRLATLVRARQDIQATQTVLLGAKISTSVHSKLIIALCSTPPATTPLVILCVTAVKEDNGMGQSALKSLFYKQMLNPKILSLPALVIRTHAKKLLQFAEWTAIPLYVIAEMGFGS